MWALLTHPFIIVCVVIVYGAIAVTMYLERRQ
jgi:hypothetical protein